MATHRIPILGAATLPDATGDMFFENYDVKAANDRWKYLVGVFNNGAAAAFLFGMFGVPKNYIGAPKFIIHWTSATTAGNIVFDVAYRAVGGTDTESLDQTGQSEQVLGASGLGGPSIINERVETSIALTGSNFAADDTVQFEISRDPTDGNDTKADAITVHGIYFEYDDV